MTGNPLFTKIKNLFYRPSFRWGIAGIMVMVIYSTTPSAAIEALSETESREVTAEGGLSYGDTMGTITTPQTEETKKNNIQSTDADNFASEQNFNAAFQLLFPLAGLTENQIREMLSRAEVRVGVCDLLTGIEQKNSGTKNSVNGFTFILPECELKTPPQRQDLTVSVPGTDNAEQSMGQIRRSGGVINLQGGIVEISGPLPQVSSQTP